MNKPGFKTTEFWLSLAAVVVGFVASSGVFEEGSTEAKIVGLVVTVLGALGYTAARALTKGTEAKAKALVDSAKK